MGLLEGGYISGDKLVLDETLIPLPRLISSLVQNRQAVTLGMRREAVSVSTNLTSTDGIRLRGEVEAYETDYVHRLQTVYLRTGHWRYAGICPLEVNLAVGQRVQAQIDLEKLYFFDTNTGLRL
jgi:ABC-type sugar transport system ATPase subunit